MAKKIFGVYLAKLDTPNSEAHARLELPASPWELHDAMDKVQLQENEELYLEIDDYYGFEYLAPHLMELDASLNELNDLAGRLAVLDETEQEAFDGLLRLEIQRKVESNGGILTMQDLRNLAVSAGADCCHVVGATSDAAIPPELQYVEVISVTASSGYDANTGEVVDEKELPSTVTLLVTTEQAKVLAELEQDSELHLALVYRGTPENAAKFIAAQDALIEELYAKPEPENSGETAEGTESKESEGAEPSAESEATE